MKQKIQRWEVFRQNRTAIVDRYIGLKKSIHFRTELVTLIVLQKHLCAILTNVEILKQRKRDLDQALTFVAMVKSVYKKRMKRRGNILRV